MRLSDAQREMLCEMTNSAYLEIRYLAEAGKIEQGFDLAAVFHYLLDDIWNDEFSLPAFRDKFLDGYQLKYPDPATENYVAWVDRIIAMGNESETDLKQPSPAKTAQALKRHEAGVAADNDVIPRLKL